MIAAMQSEDFISTIDNVGTLIQKAAEQRQTIFVSGNGGSWTDADHFAGELRAQFEVKGRPAVPSLALPVGMSTLTAWGNDYDDGFETAMVRDLEAMSKSNDSLIAISTSGKAKNIRKAMVWAKEHGMTVIAISGNGPQSNEFGTMADHHIVIPHGQTARIQEGYQIVIHMLCAYIDKIKA